MDVLKKYHSEYINNVVKNINLAMSYKPGVDEKPEFTFMGDANYKNQIKGQVESRTDPKPSPLISSANEGSPYTSEPSFEQ